MKILSASSAVSELIFRKPKNAMHIGITALRLKKWYYRPTFYWHTFRCFFAARKAQGNIHTQLFRTLDGTFLTLSAWETQEDMKRFVLHPVHIAAIKIFPQISDIGKVYNYEAEVLPTWSEARKTVQEKGREYGETPYGPQKKN